MNARMGVGLGLCLGLGLALGAAAAEVKDGYKRPVMVIPYAVEKPKIDGVMNHDEWHFAASINALQTTNHRVSARQTRFWMMWDEDNLYLAMRSPLRQGERVIQALRNPARDINVVFDDSYEIWLDVGATDAKTGLVCFTQFLCNFAGTRFDTLHQPSVGNSRLDYQTNWQPANRITPDGRAWEWELAIPRASLYKDTPFADGFKLTCLVARNFKRPWEQNSVSGTSDFSSRESHPQYVLRKTAPALHVLRVGDPTDPPSLGMELTVTSRTAGGLKWRFASDGGVLKEGDLAWPAPGGAHLPYAPLDVVGKGNFRLTVTSADGAETLFDWCAERQFGDLKTLAEKIDDTGDKVGLRLEFNPVHNYLRVFGDLINYDARAQIARYRVQVLDAAGKALGTLEPKLDELVYVRGLLQLGDLPFGDYTATLTAYDAAGKEVLTREEKFTKKDHAKAFAWWQTPLGNIEKVIEPWTPVTVKGDTLGVWGRTMQVGAAGLPAQVTTQGTPLLAAPARLELELEDGQKLVADGATAKVVSNADHRVVVEVPSRLGPLAVKATVTVEFDGMYKVDWDLRAAAGQAAITAKSLRLVVPLTNAAADYIHACGEGIRTGFYYGFVDRQKQGRIWDGRAVDSQPNVIGSFFPYLWVGSPAGGLCWFADSDQGWEPNNDTPALELRRDAPGSVDMALNLISAPARVDQPRQLSFAFQASPVKPMHPQWRMDSWWCGDTFKDYSSCGSLIWSAIPFAKDVAKCKQMVEQQHAGKNSFIFGINKYRANAVPYFIHQSLPAHLVPEVKYFGDEWRTSVSECLYYGDTLTDYMIHNLGTWAKETGIDGYYIDNMRPVACDNLDAGRGYRLPDGRIQPTYQMFSTRRYFLRMRAAFAEQGSKHKIVLHMTNNMIIPWVGAADIAYDGEHHVIYPESGYDFMDKWSLERLRVDYSGQWGVAVNFMHEYQGQWPADRMALAMRAYTGAVGLHDALTSGNSNGLNQPFWIGRDRFGIEADDVTFVPYWQAASGVAAAPAEVRVSTWQRPGKVLLLVVNFGEATDAKVTLDAAKLGLPVAPDQWQVSDAEAGTTGGGRGKDGKPAWSADTLAPMTRAGAALTVPVARHDYRQIIVAAPAAP